VKKTRSEATASRPIEARESDAEIRRLLADYSPEIARLMAQTRRKLRTRIPRGFELLYDSYNGVGIGYGATNSYSSPVVSLLAYPRWVTLFFLYGATLDDPHDLLQGTGRRVRSIRVTDANVLDDPRVGALLEQAMRRDEAAFAAAPKLRTYVQPIARVRKPRAPRRTSASARQRARSRRQST
jgi:Domain of unknown function (DU1801)